MWVCKRRVVGKEGEWCGSRGRRLGKTTGYYIPNPKSFVVDEDSFSIWLVYTENNVRSYQLIMPHSGGFA